MKLSIDGIKDKTAWEEAGIKLPAYDVRKVAENTKASPEWVHFGIGNIFRIFIGGIADSLIEQGVSDKGITCVETFDFDVVDKIYEPFDNLVMAVTLKEDGSTDKRVLGSLTEAVKAQSASKEAWSRLKEIFANPQLEMISFTITEKGYALRDAKGAFFPFIQSDIDNGPDKAVSAMAVVAALLFERFNTCKAPLAVVSMDNCSHNGEKLRNSITEMVREWQKKGYVGQDFADYVNDENVISFPWSMIDKITPRPADSVAAALEQAGVEQMKPVITSKKTYIAPFVNAEGPQYLVIEDRFPNGRPQLEKAGVYMTDRDTVNKVERMKVTTCLNPLHTALAVYGCILGYNLIADEMKDKELSEQNLVESFLSAKRIEGCSEKTLKYYKATIQSMLDGIGKGIKHIVTDDIRCYLTEYQAKKKSSKVTIDNIRRILSSFFSWLEDEDYILKSPVRRIHKVKTGTNIKETYSDEALELMRDNCTELRDLAMIDMLASTGMRVGEMVLLNREDIDFNERECVVFGKGDKERIVYFDARTKIHLQNYLNSRKDDNPALFVSLQSPYNRMNIGGIEVRLRQLGKRLGLNKVHPHKFRRTLATMAIDKGMPIEQLQQLLGHRRIDTTLQYAMVKQSNVKIAHRKYIG